MGGIPDTARAERSDRIAEGKFYGSSYFALVPNAQVISGRENSMPGICDWIVIVFAPQGRGD
jgi:hypothetical protein